MNSKTLISSFAVLTALIFTGCIDDDTIVTSAVDSSSASYTTTKYDDGRFDMIFTINATGTTIYYYNIVDRSDIDGSFAYLPIYTTMLTSTTLSCTPINEQSFSCVDSITSGVYTLSPDPELYLLKKTITSSGTTYQNALETITVNGLQ